MVQFYKSLSSRRRLLINLSIMAIILTSIAFFTIASANPDVFSNRTPAPGALLSVNNPQISFNVSVPNELNKSSVVVKVNGQSLSATTSFPVTGGHWLIDDACASDPQMIWITEYDYTKATITANTNNLPDFCDVWVSVTDKLGNISTSEWSFKCMLPPVISNLVPANASGVNTPYPTISAKVTDNGIINNQSIILKIGSTVVNHSFNSSTGVISYVPAEPMEAGTYNVFLEVEDTAGNKSTASWYFTVTYSPTGPVIYNFTPANGAVVQVTNPQIRFLVSDWEGIDASSVQVLVNNINFPAQVKFKEIGHWEWSEDACASNRVLIWIVDDYDYTEAEVIVNTSNLLGLCNAWVSVADILGHATTAEWSFSCIVPLTISNLAPANGSNVNTAFPTISARVNGVIDTKDAQSIILKINSTQVSHSFSLSGPSTGTVSFRPREPLAAGNYSVYLEVKDVMGTVRTASWSFNVPAGTATYSAATPSPGSNVSIANPQISVKVSGTANLNQNTRAMFINGSQVSPTFSFEPIYEWVEQWDACNEQIIYVWVQTGTDYTKGTLRFNSASLPDGEIKVGVSIADSTGKPSSTLWSFQVKVPPVISNAAPANNATVATLTPAITARITDNGTIASIIMLINGNQVPTVFNPATGIVSYTPTTSLANGTDYTVSITATDAVGASTSLTWKFHVQIYGEMPFTAQCSTCHEGYPSAHPMDNCDGCHMTGPAYNHGDSCMYCKDEHGDHGADLLTRTWSPKCIDCHNAQYSSTIPFHRANNTYHNTTTSMAFCKNCHDKSLTREHYRYKDTAGNNYTCLTCHKSTNAGVINAITNKQTNCEFCHEDVGHERYHANSIDKYCGDCHYGSLTKEHMNNSITTATKGLNCSSCHFSNRSIVIRAIDTNRRNCTSCHTKGHDVYFADDAPSDVPLYPAFNWTTPMEAKLFAGEAGVPQNYLGGQLVMSNRRSNVTKNEVFNFYNESADSLISDGWERISLIEEGQGFIAEYKKGRRQVLIILYNTANRSLNGNPVTAGYRLEIWYK